MHSVLDLQQWFRDARPVFKGQFITQDGLYNPATGVTTTYGAGNVNGTFAFTPEINVGGWVAASDFASPRSLLVPEPGIYEWTIHAQFTSDATGRRRTQLQLNGSNVSASRTRLPSSGSSASTDFVSSGLVDVTAASDKITVDVFQNSGSSLVTPVFVSMVWVQST